LVSKNEHCKCRDRSIADDCRVLRARANF
jgi:hypothetical protein